MACVRLAQDILGRSFSFIFTNFYKGQNELIDMFCYPMAHARLAWDCTGFTYLFSFRSN